MISFHFRISNPFKDKFKTVFDKNYILSENKNLEVECYRNSSILTFSLDFYPIRRDHAGLDFSIGLFTWEISFNFYDKRHWDDENNKWEEYNNDNEKSY
jgi:hypothetical protein